MNAKVIWSFLFFFGQTLVWNAHGQSLSDSYWQNTICEQQRLMSGYGTISGYFGLVRYVLPTKRGKEILVKDYFLHDAIKKELNLSKSQISEIDRYLNDLIDKSKNILSKESLDEAGTIGAQQQLAETTREMEGELEKIRESCMEKVRRVLNNKQQARLTEIQFRFLILQQGFVQVLSKPGMLDYLGLDPIDFEELRQQQIAIGKDLRQKEQEIVKRAFLQLLECFDERQKAIFCREWNTLQIPQGTLSALRWQLNYSRSLEDPGVVDSLKSIGIPKFYPPIYVHSADGNLRVEFTRVDTGEKQRSQIEYDDIESLIGLLLGDSPVWLVPEQVQQIDSAYLEYKVESYKAVEPLFETLGIVSLGTFTFESSTGLKVQLPNYQMPQNDDEMEILRPMIYDASVEPASKLRKSIENILLPHQHHEIDTWKKHQSIRWCGPVADIEYGVLGKELQLSANQRKDIEKACEEILMSMTTQTTEHMEVAINKLTDELNDHGRNKISRILGKPLMDQSVDLGAVGLIYRFETISLESAQSK